MFSKKGRRPPQFCGGRLPFLYAQYEMICYTALFSCTKNGEQYFDSFSTGHALPRPQCTVRIPI